MYNLEDLNNLKKDYMDQKYPDDLNFHVLSALSHTRNEEIKTISRKKIYFPIGICAIFLLVFSTLILTRYNMNNQFGEMRINNTFVSQSNKLVFEDENIISIYASNLEPKFTDEIYNINKHTGESVSLRDIVVDDLSHINRDLRKMILGDSKFYLNDEGKYVILSESNKVIIDDGLKYKLFNFYVDIS